ncbi:MAG TPA: pyrimidine reductase family protein [Micromonosporaceae bacterium]|nr:pyrimidine reductase family protein [Micromonosporaceae bacterium]
MLRVNMVSSLDGAAWLDGRSGPLGGPADQALMKTLRMFADVILVGAGTVRVEGYQGDLIDEPQKQWRLEHGLTEQPRLVVVSRSGPPLPELLAELGDLHILCEGGPHLFGSLAALDAIDDLCLTIGPVLVGPGAGRITAGNPHPVRRMNLVHAIPDGDLLFLRYARSA